MGKVRKIAKDDQFHIFAFINRCYRDSRGMRYSRFYSNGVGYWHLDIKDRRKYYDKFNATGTWTPS